MFQFIEYLKFLVKSTNQHGVHSPFVYDLVTQCFYDRSKYEAYPQILEYRTALLHNDNLIEITDFGSGSRVFKSKSRAIKSIAKTSGTPLKRAQLLYRIVNYFKPQQTLELGTSLGIATHAMALGHKKNTVTSIEGCPKCSEFTQQQFYALNLSNVQLKTGNFETILPKLQGNSYDLVFIDGNHNKTATIQYFETLLESAHNDSIFIFDDIHWSVDMLDAWEIIKAHPKVRISIDTFFWGIIFFRKEQAKENFVIRL